MEKYKSKLINPEEIKIETKNEYINDERFFSVKITLVKSGITATKVNSGQVTAYNDCMKELEHKYLLDELDTYQRALNFVKAERDHYKAQRDAMNNIFKEQIKMFEATAPDENGQHVLTVSHEILTKLKEKLMSI